MLTNPMYIFPPLLLPLSLYDFALIQDAAAKLQEGQELSVVLRVCKLPP